MKLGFLVNPIAGMGGSVGLKGTDGELYFLALQRGAAPVAPKRARRFLKKLSELGFNSTIVAANNVMGCNYLNSFKGSLRYCCVDIPLSNITSREDTTQVAKIFMREGVDIIAFVGGDGTARDIYDAVNSEVPLIGVPAGVKMYSGVFAASPEAAALVIKDFEDRSVGLDLVEIADANEELIALGRLSIRIYGYVKSPREKILTIPSKDLSYSSDYGEKEEVAQYFIEEYMRSDTLYLLGPGSTVKAVTDLLGVEKTLLGGDALYGRRLVGRDLGEKEIIDLLSKFKRVAIVVTIIGGQGYIFGRGNQQFTSRVIRRVGKENIFVISPRSKIYNLRYLLIDTGDPKLDIEMCGYWRVITGFMEEKVILVLPACCPEAFKDIKK